MADEVNEQVTDAVTQANVEAIGNVEADAAESWVLVESPTPKAEDPATTEEEPR